MLVYFAATTQPACFFLPCQLGSGKHHDEWFWRILTVVNPHESDLFGRHAENLASLPSHLEPVPALLALTLALQVGSYVMDIW